MTMLDGTEAQAAETASSHTAPYSAENWPIGVAMMAFARGSSAPTAEGDLPEWCYRDVREAARAGFDHIDVTDNWMRPGDLSRRGLDQLSRLVAEFSLGISAIAVTRRSVIDPDEDVANENLAYALRTLDAAAALHVPVVCIGLHRPLLPEQEASQWFWHTSGASDGDNARTRRLAVDRFRMLGERAGELGIELSLEMYEETLLGSSEGCVSLVRAIDLPNVGLNPDIANIIRLHRPVEDWEEMLAVMLPHTNYWQVKNYFRDVDPATGAYFTAPAPLAYGFINYRRAIEMALNVGFSGPFCVEHYGGDALSISIVNRDYIRDILDAKLGFST